MSKAFLVTHIPFNGSDILLDVLKQTGKAGITEPTFFIGYGSGLADVYVERINDWFAPDSVVGMQTNWAYLDHLAQHIPPEAIDALLARFTHHIFITCEDKVRQAVSWSIAQHTGVYTANTPETTRFPVTYRREEITDRLNAIEKTEGRWRKWYAENQIKPLEISAESLETAAGLAKAVKAVYKHLGLGAITTIPTPTLEWVIHPQLAEFEERYRAGR